MPHFHVSSVANRASIQRHGLDWRLMGAAPGIAGSVTAELAGCYLARDEDEADWFVQMNNTGGPVDLWAVEGVDERDMVESPNGYLYLPAPVPAAALTLVRTDLVAVPD